ncbi:MAG TPA: alpha-amylase family protein [Planctomycetota bacterium]|nr:alpha-amylase family protein [Planctomycetota bacterium]
MASSELRFRQIHLDFHTSQHIAGIGSQFDPDEYADTLKKAHVDSINTFARCHHGYIYFDTKKFPERRHPHLTRNLLKEQIDACHKRDIRVPIYITVQWDLFSANEHPDWVVITDQGCLQGTKPYEPGFYRTLCVNSPYYEKLLKPFVKEVLDTLEVDGFWFDIVSPQACSCWHCRKRMEANGLDPSVPENRMKNGVEVLNKFKHDLTSFVHKHNKDALVFYNAGHVGPNTRQSIDSYTQLELESLPSGGWGYMHFPAAMRYARTLGRDCIGMTGKFHTSWGDFHSFKNPGALQFECFQMLALNAKCSVGDQLHPTGRICQTTYGLIGSVYAEVEKKEAWCRGAKPLVDIAVVSPEEFAGGGHWGLPEATLGATRLLQEGRHQFDFIDTAADLSTYELVILPDEIPVSEHFAGRIEKYLAGGGSLIASHHSGLTPKKDAVALPSLGIKLVGDAPFSPDFIVPGPKINAGLAATEHVLYMKGMQVEALPGSEVLADVVVPYFNRTWQHFCSHAHTPSSGKVGYPGIVRKGNAIYFMHPIFSQYAKNAPLWCKRLMLNAIDLLLPDPLVRLQGPATVIATLNEQPANSRIVLHLLHYIPERRGKDFDVIEDVIPVYDLKLSVKVPGKVKEVALVPGKSPLKFKQKGDRVEFTVKELAGHQMVEIV